MSAPSTLNLPAFYIPGLAKADLGEFTSLEFGYTEQKVRVESPKLTPELLKRIIKDIKDARENYLVHQPVHKILNTIDKVMNLWKDPSYPLRKLAQELLPTITGFSASMISQILSSFMTMMNGDTLKLLLKEELGDPLVLDEFRPRQHADGLSRAYGPELTTAVFAGNVPAIALPNTIYALLMKSAILGKSSSEEPLFATLFAQSIAEVDPDLARSVAMVAWKGGDEEIERIAFGAADAVVVYGSEHSVNEVRKRVPPGVRFISYGHKLSFGVIGREALSQDKVKRTAMLAATDASVFDQQGCLSPHVFYVEEGGDTTARDFAGLLAEAMETFNIGIPRGKISPDEAANINQLRGRYEFREYSDDGIALHTSSPGTDWTVIFEQDPKFEPSCLNRTIRVKPVKDVMEVAELVKPLKAYLQTMGAALPESRVIPLAEEMGKLGMDRIPPLGRMTAPSLLWRHDGRFNLLDFLRWTDVEK